MNTFFIGAAQLYLSPTDNFDLLTQKSKTYVARFPYLEMLVFSELAVGGGGALNDKYYLDRYFKLLVRTVLSVPLSTSPCWDYMYRYSTRTVLVQYGKVTGVPYSYCKGYCTCTVLVL